MFIYENPTEEEQKQIEENLSSMIGKNQVCAVTGRITGPIVDWEKTIDKNGYIEYTYSVLRSGSYLGYTNNKND